MDQLLEYLVPFVVFIVWAAGQFLNKRSKNEDEQPGSTPSGTNEEQVRSIQEEIRRKIIERRRQLEGQQQSPPPPLQRKASPHNTRHTGRRDERRTTRSRSEFPPPVSSSTEPDAFQIPKPARNLEAELEEQRKRLKESQRRAEAAKIQARERIARLAAKPKQPKVVTSLRDNVIATLSDPKAARKAILYYEILGTPVGMRRDGQSKPTWAN